MKLFKWVTTAACALPLAAMAVTTAGYEDFGDTAGVVLWRGTQANFHESTVIDVAEGGALGEPYAMTADQSATSWRRFASNQTAYTSPGKVLVYDTPGTGDGYKYNPDCTFGPLSFGGMWVKTLAINGQPFSILGSGDRKTEFGASGKSTLFKFDASYTINRQGTTTFYGDATVDIAQGATFTAQAYSGQAVAVDSAATLKLKGAGTLAVTTMNVAGTLDLTAATVPTISGNVAFAGNATLVLPAGTNPTTEAPLTVCSGTLSTAGVVYVKVGDAEPAAAELTISGGTITQITTGIQTEQTFTSDYPSVVPAGYTYTYEAAEAVTIPAVTVNGTLKTSGPITITDLDIANGADFEVVAGNTTVNCSADCKLKGNIKVDAGATLTNTRTDSLSYNHSMTVDIYGTLAMGTTRWSVPGGCTFKLHAGAQVTGAGDTHASLDFINGANRGLDVYAGEGTGSVTIEGKMRVRANETRIWIAENTTLVLASGIADGGGHHAGFKQVGPGTLEIHANSVGLSGNASIMTQGTLRLVDTNFSIPVRLDGDSSYLEVVATEAATIVPVNVWTANNNITFSGAGKVNGSIMKASSPSGNLAAALQSSAWIGTFVADWEGSHNTQFDINSYGNANSVVEVRRLVGGFVSGSNANVTVVPTVRVFGFMKLGNGYSGKITTLTKLTGDGVFTNESYSVDITTLDNFTGTLVPLIDSQYVGMKIGTINLTAAPAAGDKIVNLGEGANIGQIANTKVSVNGVTDESFTGKLEVKSDGIYVKSTVTITVPAVANATATATIGGEPVALDSNGQAGVPADSVVTVTYAANEGYVISGTTEYTIDTATATTFELDESTKVAQYVARVRNTTTSQDDKFTSLAAAVAATGDGSHASQVVLLANVDEAEVTVSSAIMLMGNYTISSDITVSDGGALQVMQPTLAGTLTIEDGGTYVTSGGSLASVVAEDGATIQLTTLSTETAPLAIANLTVEGDLTVVASWFGATRGTDYKAISYVTANATIAQDANIDGAAEWSADSYVDGNNTVVTLAITAVATVDGVYYDDAQDAVDAAVASGEPVSFLVAPGTVTLGAGETLVVSGATLPTVVLEDGLTTPPYEIEHTIDTENLTNTYAVKAYVAQITRSEYSQELGPQNVTYKFESIAEAVENANAGETIKVIADNTMTGNAIAFAKSLTLDLNGFTTTHAGNGHAFEPTSSATFTITDTSDGAAGKVVSASKIVLSGSPCTFTLTAGTLQSDSVPVYIWGNGPASERVVNINGGKLVCGSNSNADSCIMVSSGTIRMSAGVIESVCCGFEGTEVNVSGGNVTVGVDKVFRRSTDRASGGTFNRDVSEYCVSGKICVPNGDGTYTVRAGTWIAQVGSTKYESLAAAVAAAEAGQTVTMLADDRVSFTEDNLELSIGKALTINGAGYTIYGVNDYAYDGAHDHDIYISGSGDVTIKNVTLAEFGGAVANNMRTYPIWTGSAYTGTLTLDNVTVRNFNRTAFNLNGGTVVVKDCTITGDKSKDTYFQSGIEAYNANVTVQGTTTITGTGSNLVDWPEAACLQLGNPNGSVAGTGSITVTGGTFTGDYGIIVASNASEVVSVTGGTFNGVLEVEDGEGGSLAISGGTFNAVVPDEYLAEGYEVLDNGDGTYGVREDKGWIYAAPGYWNYTGTWSEGATLGEEKVTIEDGATYTASEASDGQLVTLDMTLSFDGANDDDDDFGDAKAAIRLGAGETEGTYVFQLYTYEGSAATWKNATGFTPTVETDYNVLFVLDLTNKTYTASIVSGSTTNALSVGGSTTIAFANQNNTTPVQQIDFVGSGTVSSIEGSYEDAPAPEGFVENDEVTLSDGTATLTAAQATWLNACGAKAAVAAKIATMDSTAFNNAYLLNLGITGDFSYDFKVSNINVAGENVTLTVSLTRTGALANKINGTVALTGTDELGKTFATISEAVVTDDDFSDNGSTTTITLKTGGAKFFQPTIE